MMLVGPTVLDELLAGALLYDWLQQAELEVDLHNQLPRSLVRNSPAAAVAGTATVLRQSAAVITSQVDGPIFCSSLLFSPE